MILKRRKGKNLDDARFASAIERMIKSDLKARGIEDERVLEAMRSVPRYEFVPEFQRANAYADNPLHLNYGQTISQPYMVAAMTEALNPEPHHRVLEIGTGSGYQTAILCELVKQVFSVERIENLLSPAEDLLNELGYRNAAFLHGDGTLGWPEHAPYDGIIVTAGAPTSIPPGLKQQLSPDGGVLVIPAGPRSLQTLWRIKRRGEKFEEENLMRCSFVPLVGKDGFPGDPVK